MNLNDVKLAALLHDVIYDSKASDNEERSAVYAERLCEELAIPVGKLVADLIRKTKTHDAGEDADAQVLLDADLAILGASEMKYQSYAENIRREYAWVPEPDYRKGRRQILEKFLTRPKIYHFLSQLEQPARRNLADEITPYAFLLLRISSFDGRWGFSNFRAASTPATGSAAGSSKPI